MNYVIKRDGSEEKYSRQKIENVMRKAFKGTKGVKYDKNVYKLACTYIEGYLAFKNGKIGVETVQNFIEQALAETGHNDVQKNYILYRNHRAQIRDWVSSKENFIEKYKVSSNTADATVDDNSNVASKNIAILNNEIHKEDNIQISRKMIMNKLKKLFPDFDAKQYIRDLNDHIIYKHDESSFAGAIAPYCVSISMYPFLTNGIKDLGGLSAAPKNLDSYCGMYINLIFAIASQYAGAVATSEFLLYFDYFARKEWGDMYYDHTDVYTNTDFCNRRKTIKDQIHQYFQQVVYSINQPAAARGMQAAFVNFSYFDKPFFEGMFGDFCFPDGSKAKWESLCWLQKEFMQWFNEERLKCILTFPVESFALVYQDGHFLDQDSADFVAAEYARGHSFFTYISDTVDSLSSCCFKGDEVIKIIEDGIEKSYTLKEFVEKYIEDNSECKIDKELYIDSYNQLGEKNENTKITGLLKKKYTGDMYLFEVNGKKIQVTPDHLLLVRKISDGTIQSIPAEYVYNNIEDYEIGFE